MSESIINFCNGFSILLFCINIYYCFYTIEDKCQNSQKSYSKHVIYLPFYHPLWMLWDTFILVVKATSITLLLVPYFWHSDHWSWNGNQIGNLGLQTKYQKLALCHIVMSPILRGHHPKKIRIIINSNHIPPCSTLF